MLKKIVKINHVWCTLKTEKGKGLEIAKDNKI